MNFKTFFNEIILEKDNRPKILKMGVSQEVADYLHGIHDKYSLWFADKLKKMPGFETSRNQIQFVRNLQTQMTGILDWVRNVQNIQLNNYDWNQALTAQQEYHDSLGVSELTLEKNNIIQKYDDGFYWVDLKSCSDTDEASAMGHCATTNKGETLYSLRAYNKATESIEPFITIAVTPNKGQWHQCKGKRNSKPKKQYYRYIADILIKNKIFHYVSEYDSRSDFGPQDFIEYLEENSDSISNADEIIEKIKESSITLKDFDKILKEFKEDLTYYYITLDQYDVGDYVQSNYYFQLNLTNEDTDLDVSCLDFTTNEVRKYISIILNVNVDNFEVYTIEGGIRIDLNISDSDNTHSLDEQGLSSFRRQCQYYAMESKSFDKEEFVENHLRKILVLDGCMEHDLDNFKEQVKENLSDTFSIITHLKTLDVEISSIAIRSVISKSEYSSDSVLRRADMNTGIIFKTPKELSQQRGYASEQHSDLLLYTIFWDFIKENVLQIPTKTFKIVLDSSKDEFKFKFFYEWENEDYDFEKEYSTLVSIEKKINDIRDYFHKFEKEVIKPFIADRILADIDSFTVKSSDGTWNGMTQFYVYHSDQYIGYIEVNEDADEQAIKAEIAHLIKDKNITGGYKKLNIGKVDEWLINNISHQMTFKGFFENYLNTLRKS
jgi:hypothetical protein